jgi:hypothetical protein
MAPTTEIVKSAPTAVAASKASLGFMLPVSVGILMVTGFLARLIAS